MPLQGFVDASSSSPIVNGALKMKADYLPNNYIIATGNPLVDNSKTAIENHFDSTSTFRLTNDHVNTYLASSALLHSLDGWTYFSHAIDSLLKGDNGIAIHLAYYSELRATMSFLATEGIGIFDNKHFRLSAANHIEENPRVPIVGGGHKSAKTHQFTWDVIEKWANSTVKCNNSSILKIFSVYNKSFEEWAAAFPFPTSINANLIVAKWLKKWNLDVRHFRNDREMRNNVSYRPQRLVHRPSPYTSNDIVRNLGSLWDLLEPNSSNRFQNLDKYLLKMFLQEIYNSLSGAIRLTNSLESVIIQTLDNLRLNHDESLIKLLSDKNAINHIVFSEATKDIKDPITGSLNAMPIIARSVLMLRISTGSTSLIYKNAGITIPDLTFLWEQFGVENGLWDTGNIPEDFDELWDDIKDNISDIIDFSDIYSPNLSLHKIYSEKDFPLPFNYFKQFQRAGLWGMAI